jgi:hypothetical protein
VLPRDADTISEIHQAVTSPLPAPLLWLESDSWNQTCMNKPVIIRVWMIQQVFRVYCNDSLRPCKLQFRCTIVQRG